MRKVVKNLADKPEILDFAKTPSSLAALEAIITNKRVEDEHGEIYRGSYKDEQGITQSSVRDKLNGIYFEKCAYCESNESAAQIEHYRPKNRVTGTGGANNGYFWLCFEWSNLVPSCFDCNKIGTGKGNKFPIIVNNKRHFDVPRKADNSLDFAKFRLNSSYLTTEKAFLLHPEKDNPKRFFKFGWVQNQSLLNLIGKDTESRGEESIKICNLNRKNLGRNRYQRLSDVIIEPIKENLGLFLAGTKTIEIFKIDLEIIFKKLKNRVNDDKAEFTLMWWYAFESVENFTEIVGATLPVGIQRDVVINQFKEFKQNQ